VTCGAFNVTLLNRVNIEFGSGYTQPITHPLIGAAPAAPEPAVPAWAGFTPGPAYQTQEEAAPPAPAAATAAYAPPAEPAAPRPIPPEHQCIKVPVNSARVQNYECRYLCAKVRYLPVGLKGIGEERVFVSPMGHNT
jgi:hypothetical protein